MNDVEEIIRKEAIFMFVGNHSALLTMQIPSEVFKDNDKFIFAIIPVKP